METARFDQTAQIDRLRSPPGLRRTPGASGWNFLRSGRGATIPLQREHTLVLHQQRWPGRQLGSSLSRRQRAWFKPRGTRDRIIHGRPQVSWYQWTLKHLGLARR